MRPHPCHRYTRCNRKHFPGRPTTQVELGRKTGFLLGQYPAAYGLLGGGRNSLLESAQEATLMSVPTWQSSVNLKKPNLRAVSRIAVPGFAIDR